MDASSTPAGLKEFKPFDLNGLQTYDLKSRPSKVFVEDLGQPLSGDQPMSTWAEALPHHGAANDLRRVRDHICQAHRDGRTMAVSLARQPVEDGCGPYIVDWVRRGVVRAVSLSGAAAIHDFELAACGKTSEEIGDQLSRGRYGMARETADAFAVAARAGAADDLGLGAALGRCMETMHCPHGDISVILAAHRAGIPCTVHVSLGADTVHVHPHVCGGALGAASMIDFRRLCSVVTTLAHGVWLNLGGGDALPETYLQAMAVARNFGHSLEGVFTAHMQTSGQKACVTALDHCPGAIELGGHYEIILPLLHAAVECHLAPPAPVQTSQAA
jgi:hypothetical protein